MSFPVEAALKHRGSRLYGTMVDVNGQHNQSLRIVLEESGLPNEEIKQFILEVRSNFPESPVGEIEYHAKLPERSLIEGKIEHSRVSFTKRYEGYHEIEYVLNGLRLPDSIPCELVQYAGVMTPDFKSISGDWSISPVNKSETTITGTFQLNRHDAG